MTNRDKLNGAHVRVFVINGHDDGGASAEARGFFAAAGFVVTRRAVERARCINAY